MASSIIQSIAYAAGKSGGHIIPCLTLMVQQPAIDTNLFFTTDASLDKKIIHTNNTSMVHMALPLSQSYNTWYKKPVLFWHLFISFCISLYMLWKYKPVQLITTGGLVSIPVSCAAYIVRIPITLYELNAIPGKSARFIGYMANIINVCFADAQQYFASDKTCMVPYPIRYTPSQKITKKEACQQVGLNPDIPILLIIGGSQGSIQLNALAKDITHDIKDIQIIHQIGDTDTFNWQQWYHNNGIPNTVFTYDNNMVPYIAAADLVLCRAGAGSLFELMYFDKQCIIIPLEGAADDHQVANAYAMQKQYPHLCTIVRHSIQEKSSHVISNLVKQKIKQYRKNCV
jgi:UDP-N-acetylglucosamine--N-acetylmuramyl-(pentapeptide) pyrophosphoryl-undecaprenol N-acetylglucosamine transferase